jgi:tetratricopeptide (TPR) repeat protein
MTCAPRLALALVAAAALAFHAGAGAGVAHAEDPRAAARAHYEAGIAKYDLADYDGAIIEFKTAYELSREPGLLFNLAQAHRLKKDYSQALHFYRTFVELDPNAPNRADAETQIVKLEPLARAAAEEERLAREREAAAAALVRAPPPPAPAPPRTPFASTRRGRAVIVLSVLGGAALAAGAGTGGFALSERARYDGGCDAGRCDPALYQDGRRLAIASDALLGAGAVMGAVALILVITQPRGAHR